LSVDFVRGSFIPKADEAYVNAGGSFSWLTTDGRDADRELGLAADEPNVIPVARRGAGNRGFVRTQRNGWNDTGDLSRGQRISPATENRQKIVRHPKRSIVTRRRESCMPFKALGLHSSLVQATRDMRLC
jgi:hypothetical protein